ncbi:beta-ketoacyl synthase N-terminal-like domain-containing protein [Cupriavidus basilensis]|uniref:Beta-ketoacyl synthase N-terminal-like domain-containing protein n=1 Tax=Cupriavidus basilensis TaxID=68895 RepID=A0ABT6AUH7_9BURK|nr:beta-ketoacyl synthase N-terminal-like domain-containing protein [Cupriavidus basilensis]MDF3835346.1 beta-ketoacyl synthase N-terminal-like domain-containing protein [Cupriavidus basilensis]
MKLAVTGSAMVTSVGEDKHRSFEALCAGQSGRKPLQSFDADRFNVSYAYEIADRPNRQDRVLRASEMLAKAVAAAVEEARLSVRDAAIGIIVGTGLRELRSLELFWTKGEPLTIDQLHFERILNETLGSALPVITVSNACSASSFALALAEDFISDGTFSHVIVGGCDAITESMFGLLDRVNPLHPDRVQPFERDRKGVLMGDGAAAVVVESVERAAARQADLLAVVRSVGTSCDAIHETAPDTGGLVRAIRDAYARGGVAANEVDLAMVHGTGTSLNDEAEAQAMHEAMGEAANAVRVSALKSMTGHTSGASGLVGVVTAIEALNNGVVPPTIGLVNVMDGARTMNFVREGWNSLFSGTIAQVNAFGFGGVNAVVILEKEA